MTMVAVENAAIRLLRRRPFYGHLLMQIHKSERSLAQPAGLTIFGGVPTLFVDSVLFGLLDADYQEALIEHMLKHLLHLHMFRRKGRNTRLWDIAADMAINGSIDLLAETGAVPSRYGFPEGLAAEEYYGLLARFPSTGNQEGYGAGQAEVQESGDKSGSGNRSLAGSPDDHQVWNDADATPQPLAEKMVRHMVREAYRGSDGDVPADVKDLVRYYLGHSPVPWRQVLRQFIGAAGRSGRKGSWKKEHRRFGHETPGMQKRRMLNLLIAVDVSESTDTGPLREAFAREILAIARGRESKLTVVYANSRMQQIEVFSNMPCVMHAYRGGGFTDLRPAFEFARQMKPAPAAIIYLTDGKGPAPEYMPLPTLWVLTADGEKPAPWGVELRLTE